MPRVIRKPKHIDVYGLRQDGGLDLVIVGSGPLDARADTRRLLLDKVGSYVSVFLSDGGRASLGFNPSKRLNIVLALPAPPAPETEPLLASARELLSGRVPGARLVVQVYDA